MIKELIEQAGLNVRQLSQRTEIPYSTLNDVVNGKVDIRNVKFGYIVKITDELSISIDDFTKRCMDETNLNSNIVVKNKEYYLNYADKLIKICKVNTLSTKYINEIAEWVIEDLEEDKELDTWQEKLTY